MFLVVSDAGDLESRRVSWREARARCPYVFWKAKANLTRESVRVAQRQGGSLFSPRKWDWGGRAVLRRGCEDQARFAECALLFALALTYIRQPSLSRREYQRGLYLSRKKTQTARWMAAPTGLPVCPCSIRINSCWALLTADGPSLAVTQRPAQRGLVGN